MITVYSDKDTVIYKMYAYPRHLNKEPFDKHRKTWQRITNNLTDKIAFVEVL